MRGLINHDMVVGAIIDRISRTWHSLSRHLNYSRIARNGAFHLKNAIRINAVQYIVRL